MGRFRSLIYFIYSFAVYIGELIIKNLFVYAFIYYFDFKNYACRQVEIMRYLTGKVIILSGSH